MTITTFENLQQWFSAQNRGDEVASHWNLYGTRFGETEKRVAFNNSIDSKQESFDYLVQNIRALNNPDGSIFRLQVFPKGKANNPTGNIYIQIYAKQPEAAANTTAAAVAGLPPGMGSISEYIDSRVKMARMEWELEQLKEAANAPTGTFERVIDGLGQIPGIDKALQALVAGIVTKYNPQALPAVQAAMNGTPASNAGDHEPDDDTDPQTIFAENINSAAQKLQTDPLTLAHRLNALVSANPELAKQMLNG